MPVDWAGRVATPSLKPADSTCERKREIPRLSLLLLFLSVCFSRKREYLPSMVGAGDKPQNETLFRLIYAAINILGGRKRGRGERGGTTVPGARNESPTLKLTGNNEMQFSKRGKGT